MFELKQLRCFVAVASEMNFHRAADRLNMTQPPLSRQIKQLEHAIGIELFDRSGRQIRLTPGGERFLLEARDLLRRAEDSALVARAV
ncbi:MAG TPA: LysR family transcriptional regulator, partial [Citreicella sp.]|nr:LysR family transcriptional regulator [Citreicella sp.]